MRAFLTAVLILCAPMVMAEPEEWVPAEIGDHERSLRNTIKLPAGVKPDETILVFCGVLVDGSGRIDEHFCFPDRDTNQAVQLRIAVEQTLKFATFKPATVNGTPDQVWTQFTVAFAHKDGEPVMRVYPHIGENPDLAWDDYQSPQVLTESVRWYVYENRIRKCKLRFLLFTDLLIDEEGKAELIKVNAVDKLGPKGCIKYAKQLSELRQYIPGRVNGQIRPLHLYEVWAAQVERLALKGASLQAIAAGKWKPERYPEL